jgi:hypothetical protein
LSDARLVASHEWLPTGRPIGLGDRARDLVGRLLVAIGARAVPGWVLSPSSRGAPPAASVSRPLSTGVEPAGLADLSRFVYELLDAHDDTARIAREPPGEMSWDAHLDYLRALQRKGRELLALLDERKTGAER